MLSNASEPQVAFVSSGSDVIKRTAGAVVKTGNALDLAVKGEGWLSVATPQGQAYTRDGRLQMDAAGNLVSSSGAPLLDAGGAPIQLDPNGGLPEIGSNGTIIQGGKPGRDHWPVYA